MKRLDTVLLRIAVLIAILVGGGLTDPEELWAKAAPDLSESAFDFADSVDEFPLNPADSSSPRATFTSFLDNMNRSFHLVSAVVDLYESSPDSFDNESIKSMVEEAEQAFIAAEYCLDLSMIHPAYAAVGRHEAALYFKEIFDRIDIPSFYDIPDAEEEGKPVEMWRVPNTEIAIVRIEEGPRKGEYHFSAESVSRIIEYYQKVEHLPYKSYAPVSPGFLRFYSLSPGVIVPSKWLFSAPVWMGATFLGHTVLQWSIVIVYILIATAVFVVLFRRLRKFPRDRSEAFRRWLWTIYAAAVCVALALLKTIAVAAHLFGIVLIVVTDVLVPVTFLIVGIGIYFVAVAIAETIIASPNIDPEGLKASYFRATSTVFGFFAVLVFLILGLTRVGVPPIHLLAGVGVSGLAIALAIRPMLEGVIGSFLIFGDSPYKVGERVKVSDQDGVVESIGLLSTRLRSGNGHQTSIPNVIMVSLDIENISRRPFIQRKFTISLDPDTPPSKVSRAIDIVRETLSIPDGTDTALPEEEGAVPAHPNVPVNQADHEPRVFFNEMSSESQDLFVIYWFFPPHYWDYMEHCQSVNFAIKRGFAAEGIEYAVPTRKLRLENEDAHPSEEVISE